ncbi:gliding motility-associated C-terminal domain-containing protein [Dyadobacter sp. CY345]|uniref:T9SS type B sorting domain-containing protein n=1 Tax=Dyadobacter sp. CY345 TaxID=2909335 RepID=UPI001F395907|nr:gliding motility-associated C-terminal domain-containing protein [Dyadobacter sp. CY345]MCF2445922.1 gliding motility-associated C-terminal domain-containing protein [Dyadobacter sp. CY345]
MRIPLLSFFFVFYIFQFSCVYGQEIVGGGMCDAPIKGAFEVSPSYVGCGKLEVDFINTLAGADNVAYIPNYDRVSPIGEAPKELSATYNTVGTYTVLQVGSKGVGFSLCKQVHVLENKKIDASLEISCGKLALVKIVENNISKAYDYVEINWGDGDISEWRPGSGNINHGYSGALQKISVQGKYSSSSVNCSGQVGFLDPANVENSIESIQINRVEMQEEGIISLLYKGKEGVSTEVFYSELNGDYLSTGKVTDTNQTSSINIDKNVDSEKEYILKLTSPNSCGGNIDSREVKTMVLEATPLEGEISLKWSRYIDDNDFVGYQLFRDGAPIQSFTSIDELTFSDKDLDCNTTYKYQIAASTSQVNSFSAPKSAKMLSSTPDNIEGASVTVTDNNLITADVVLGENGLTNSYNLIVERTEQGSANFVKISDDQNQDLRFEDKGVNTATTSYCYRFKYENSCQLSTDFTEPVCSILLRQSPQELTWNNAVPFTEGLDSYAVIQNESNTQTPVGLSTNYQLDLNNQPKTEFSFRITAKSKSGNLVSFSNPIRYEQNVMLLIPDAFTPNGDNINERFEIKGLFVNSFKISVFNRWGQVVFQSSEILNSWDGTINGALAPGGYYTYKTEITDIENKPFVKEGTVFLIR